MFKKMFVASLLCMPALHADWLDECTRFVDDKDHLDIPGILALINTCIEEDQKEVARLEKKLEDNKESGVWATVKGGTYQVQWAAANSSLSYHQRVYKIISELPENKKDRGKFIEHLKALKGYQKDLAELKERYSAAGFIQKIKVGTLIAAKEIQIKSRKGYIKTAFLL